MSAAVFAAAVIPASCRIVVRNATYFSRYSFSRIVLQVVIAIGQPEAALIEIEDVVRRLLRIAIDVADHGVDQIQLEELAEMLRQIGLRLDRVDRRQLAIERREAELLDQRFVHEALVEVADLLRLGSRCLRRRLARFLDDGLEVGLGFVEQHVECAVGGLSAGISVFVNQPPLTC